MSNTIKTILAVLLLLSIVATSVSAKEMVDVTAEETVQYNTVEAFAISVNGDVNADGKVDSLDAAQILKYDADIISEFDNKVGETPALTEELEAEICTAFCRPRCYAEYPLEVALPLTYVYSYCGNFEGWDVVMLMHPFAKEEMIWTSFVGGYGFHYYSGDELIVYKDGNAYWLSDAYNNGYITDSAVYDIAIKCGTLPENLWLSLSAGSIFEDYDDYVVRNLFGDANNDRKVDSLDAAWILKHDAGLVE